MHVLRVFDIERRRAETEDASRIESFVGKPSFNKPVKNTVKSHPIDSSCPILK